MAKVAAPSVMPNPWATTQPSRSVQRCSTSAPSGAAPQPRKHLLAPGPDAAGRFAALLAELVRLAPDPAALSTLAPSPPWAAWDHDHPGLWPPPDDRPGRPERRSRPALARPGRRRRPDAPGRAPTPPVAGHADWES